MSGQSAKGGAYETHISDGLGQWEAKTWAPHCRQLRAAREISHQFPCTRKSFPRMGEHWLNFSVSWRFAWLSCGSELLHSTCSFIFLTRTRCSKMLPPGACSHCRRESRPSSSGFVYCGSGAIRFQSRYRAPSEALKRASPRHHPLGVLPVRLSRLEPRGFRESI